MDEQPRDRALTDQEIVWFWKGCDELGWPFGHVFKLLLLTAQRRDEVGMLEWPELDLEQRMWTIPGERAKNGKPHLVPLSEPAIEILTELAEHHRVGKDLVFTTTGTTPACNYSRPKAKLDKLMEGMARKDRGLPVEDDKYRAALGLSDKADLPMLVQPWILHDLRRTGTTAMASDEKLNIAPHVVDKILNHTSGTISGVARVYNTNQYLKERRSALDAWGRYVLALMQPAEAKVVQLRPR